MIQKETAEYARIVACWATGLCCEKSCIAWDEKRETCKILSNLQKIANALENLLEITDKEPEPYE